MATPLTYDPPPAPPDTTADDELRRFVDVLHESGTLRLLTNLMEQGSAIGEVAAQGLDTPGGRRGLGNVMVLLGAFGRLDPDATQRFVDGADRGLGASRDVMRRPEVPSLLDLFRAFRSPDVRRGLGAALALLGRIGGALHDRPDQVD